MFCSILLTETISFLTQIYASGELLTVSNVPHNCCSSTVDLIFFHCLLILNMELKLAQLSIRINFKLGPWNTNYNPGSITEFSHSNRPLKPLETKISNSNTQDYFTVAIGSKRSSVSKINKF